MKKNLLIFVPMALSLLVLLFIFDTRLCRAARELLPADFYIFAKLITNWGLYVFYAIFAALFVYSIIKKNRHLTGFCLAYLKAQLIVSFAVVRLLKIVLGRGRPGYGGDFTFFSLNSRYNAFPSGHAADAFASGVFLYLLLKQSTCTQYRYLPLIYAFLIAISRVFVSAHYPSDVAAGMLIGVLGAWFFATRLPDADQREK
jgi:undecaprenyl-diphosphatase